MSIKKCNYMFVCILVCLLLSSCFLKLTPQQASFFLVNGNPDIITSEEIEKILPKFAEVKEGEYKLVPVGLVKRKHNAPWCFSGTYGGTDGDRNITISGLLYPLEGSTRRSSEILANKMRGYAFGIANVLSNEKGKPNFTANIFMSENKDIYLYNILTCQWLEPHVVNEIIIF